MEFFSEFAITKCIDFEPVKRRAFVDLLTIRVVSNFSVLR